MSNTPSELDHLDLNVDDAEEPVIIEDDNEHLIEILKVTFYEADEEEETSARISVFLECPDEEFSKGFDHTLWIPAKGDTKKQRNASKWAIRLFKEAFALPVDSTMNFPDWVGQQTWATLGVRKSEGYDDRNKIREFIGQKPTKK